MSKEHEILMMHYCYSYNQFSKLRFSKNALPSFHWKGIQCKILHDTVYMCMKTGKKKELWDKKRK